MAMMTSKNSDLPTNIPATTSSARKPKVTSNPGEIEKSSFESPIALTSEPLIVPAAFTILHIADLRYGWKGPHDLNEIQHLNAYKALIQTFSNCEESRLPLECRKPNVVAITGDIAYQGSEEQYRKCQSDIIDPLLKVLGLEKDQLLVCPGNHDIDPNQDKRGAFTPEKNRSIDGEKRWNLSEEAFGELCAKFSPYSNHFFGKRDISTLVYKKSFSDVDFFSFNTAWYSSYHESGEGQLLLGKSICKKNVDEAHTTYHNNGKPTIALLHHPLEVEERGNGWFHIEEYDPRYKGEGVIESFLQYFKKSFYIILTGSPVYESNIIPVLRSDYLPIIISSGITGLKGETTSFPAYSAAIVRIEGAEVHIYILRYYLYQPDNYWKIVNEFRFGGDNPIQKGLIERNLNYLNEMLERGVDREIIRKQLQTIINIFGLSKTEYKNKYKQSIQNENSISGVDLTSDNEIERTKGRQ